MIHPILNENVCGCYVLLLENNHIYVGSSANIPRRLSEHLNGYDSGGSKQYCGWTNKYKPLHIYYTWKTQFINHHINQTHVYTRKVSMERAFTLMAFELWGIDKVRGHAYSTVNKDYSKSEDLIKQLTSERHVTQSMIACDFIIDKGLPEEDVMELRLSDYTITEYFDALLKRYHHFIENDPATLIVNSNNL